MGERWVWKFRESANWYFGLGEFGAPRQLVKPFPSKAAALDALVRLKVPSSWRLVRLVPRKRPALDSDSDIGDACQGLWDRLRFHPTTYQSDALRSCVRFLLSVRGEHG